jgi:hypothetical protein
VVTILPTAPPPLVAPAVVLRVTVGDALDAVGLGVLDVAVFPVLEGALSSPPEGLPPDVVVAVLVGAVGVVVDTVAVVLDPRPASTVLTGNGCRNATATIRPWATV